MCVSCEVVQPGFGSGNTTDQSSEMQVGSQSPDTSLSSVSGKCPGREFRENGNMENSRFLNGPCLGDEEKGRNRRGDSEGSGAGARAGGEEKKDGLCRGFASVPELGYRIRQRQ